MKITNLTLILATALAFTACKGDKDSGDSADSGSGDGTTDGGDGGGDDGTANVESCDWDGLGLCFEFVDEVGVEPWCIELSVTSEIPMTYSAAACAPATHGICSGVTGGDFGSYTATVYFYAEFGGDPEAVCLDSAGTYTP